jgi:subtilisin family serine protease
VEARSSAILAALRPERFALRRRYASVNALAGSVDARGLLELLGRSDVVRVGLDREIQAQLAEAVPLVGLDALQLQGHSGTGIQVAVIDTGVQGTHEDLVGAVIAEACFCLGGCCYNSMDTDSGPGSADDFNGHGTRVAGILRSNGTAAPVGGAPGTEIVAIKVLNNSGTGNASDFVAGLDWIIANRPDVDVINASLGGGLYGGDCDDADAVTMAYAAPIDLLRSNGVLTVAGSGNDGDATRMIAPACVANALSVGAVWDSNVGSRTVFGCTDPTTEADQVPCWSNATTTLDTLAPGGVMTSSYVLGGTVNRIGTSYAAPVVTACAAVMLGVDHGLSPSALENAMEATGVTVTDPRNGLDHPRIDCAAALDFATAIPVASLDGPRRGLLVLTLGALAAGWLARRSNA